MKARPHPSLLAVLVASAVTLILVGRSGGPLAAGEGALRSVARAAFAPAESAGDAVFRPLEHAFDRIGERRDLAVVEAERDRERQRAESEAARAEALEAEVSRLAALLRLAGPAGMDGVAARVVGTPTGRSGGSLVIDRGRADGIKVGMPVVAAGGLVGRVLEVGPGQATVLPVTDAASAVGVRTVPQPGPAGAGVSLAGDGAEPPGPTAGVAQGVGRATLRLELLDPTMPPRDGDLVVTSGSRHGLFPAGLPVGRVRSGAGGRFEVQPFAPPPRLEVVKVLRWEPGR